MTDRTTLSNSTFVIRRGKRGTSGMWVLVLAVVLAIAIVSLAVAISRPTRDGSGGAGAVVLPALLAVFSLLGLGISLGQWWDDETHFRVVDDRLTVHHGTRRLHGRSVRFVATAPVTVSGEGNSGDYRVFVEQGGTRVILGTAPEILPIQFVRWEAWMRAMGCSVQRRLPGR